MKYKDFLFFHPEELLTTRLADFYQSKKFINGNFLDFCHKFSAYEKPGYVTLIDDTSLVCSGSTKLHYAHNHKSAQKMYG